MRVPSLAGWVVAAAAAGCGPKAPPPAPTLTVTADGRPAPRLIVQLVAADGKAAATGATDAAGRAVVRGGDGGPPPPGTYKLVAAEVGDEEPDPMAAAKDRPKAAPRLDRRYATAASTPATITIEAGKGEYAADLTAKP